MRHCILCVVLSVASVGYGQTVTTVRVSQRFECGANQCKYQHGTASPWRNRNGGCEYLTAAHCVDKSTSCTVAGRAGRVTFRSLADDVALVFVPGVTAAKTYQVNTREYSVGQRIAVYGNPGVDSRQRVIVGTLSAWQQASPVHMSARRFSTQITQANSNSFAVRKLDGRPINESYLGAMSGGPAIAVIRGRRCIVGVLSCGDSSGVTISRLTCLNRFRPSVARRTRQQLSVGQDPFAGFGVSVGAGIGGGSPCVPCQPCGPSCQDCGNRCGQCPPNQMQSLPQPQLPQYDHQPQVIRGERGARGERGPRGEKGDKPSAQEVAQLFNRFISSNREQLRGPRGPAGRDGKSVTSDQLAGVLNRVIAENPDRFRGPAGQSADPAELDSVYSSIGQLRADVDQLRQQRKGDDTRGILQSIEARLNAMQNRKRKIIFVDPDTRQVLDAEEYKLDEPFVLETKIKSK